MTWEVPFDNWKAFGRNFLGMLLANFLVELGVMSFRFDFPVPPKFFIKSLVLVNTSVWGNFPRGRAKIFHPLPLAYAYLTYAWFRAYRHTWNYILNYCEGLVLSCASWPSHFTMGFSNNMGSLLWILRGMKRTRLDVHISLTPEIFSVQRSTVGDGGFNVWVGFRSRVPSSGPSSRQRSVTRNCLRYVT